MRAAVVVLAACALWSKSTQDQASTSLMLAPGLPISLRLAPGLGPPLCELLGLMEELITELSAPPELSAPAELRAPPELVALTFFLKFLDAALPVRS